MKKSLLHLWLLFLLCLAGTAGAQSLVCNDLVYVSLDEDCTYTLTPEDILEGTIFPNCVVELDKVAPYGNGPWVPGVLGPSDVGKTYQVRVRHLPSGNICWGNLKAEDKLPPVLDCSSVTTLALNGGSATLSPNNLAATALDACSNSTLTPAIQNFDCSDEGVNIIQLTAIDASGNSSTCLHTVLITDPNAGCQFCISECPDPVTVSFFEGTNTLLPAFQANDLTPFDAFGNALLDAGCPYTDSTYTVTYQQGTAGNNWFVRNWQWDLGGLPVNCKQVILFPNEFNIKVQGQVYIDENDNCSIDNNESGLPAYNIQVTLQPSGEVVTFQPGANGNYLADIPFSLQDTAADLQLLLPPGINPVCPSAIHIPINTPNATITFNIGVQTEGYCPQMEIDLGSLTTRRCSTNTFNIFYCNNGLSTAQDAYIRLNLDPLITVQSASSAYTVSGPDDIYTFELGDVPPFFCATIAVTAYVSCDAELGETLCSEAHIYPDTTCAGFWAGAQIQASATCDGDSVRLTLRNVGAAPMPTVQDYIVVEDFIMYNQGSFQLNAGEDLTLSAAANGATWRIESNQVAGAPQSTPVAAAVEGCNGITQSGVVNTYGLLNNSNAYDQNCGVVIGSFDPNDKSAIPVGYTEDHIIRANEPIEYKIRFQNTGTDTAFRVVVIDTLSAYLDPRSLSVGASSHPYRLDVFAGGIIHFVFDPIALPDSNVNELGSHGYLQFRINQQPDLPDGTRIENSAAIYFDFNAPVITNTTFHTIGYPFVPNPPIEHSVEVQQITCNGNANGAIQLSVNGGVPPYHFSWSNPSLSGESVSGLAPGVYEVSFTDSYRGAFVESITITQPDPISLDLVSGNGLAAVTASGGSGAYTYLWSNGANAAALNNLEDGIYTVTVTDGNGCTQSAEVEVLNNTTPLNAVSLLTQPTCFDGANGAIMVMVSGGVQPYIFDWNDAALQGNAPNNLAAGTYTVTITDAEGTTRVETFGLQAPPAILLQTDATAATGNNADGNASASATGGVPPYAYLWSNGALTAHINDVVAGTYTVTVSDLNGCTQVESVVVEQTILPLLISSQLTHLRCANLPEGAITIALDGGLSPYTFVWSQPNLQGNELSGLAAGTYTVSITDAVGTQLVESYTLTSPDPILLTAISTPSTPAGDGTATATAAGGVSPYTFQWSNGAATASISGLPAGDYTATVTDANGCTGSVSVTVELTSGTQQPANWPGVKVWPNPTRDQFTIELQQVLADLVRVDLYAADGRQLRQLQGADLKARISIAVDADQAGGFVYVVLRDRAGQVYTEKIVIAR